MGGYLAGTRRTSILSLYRADSMLRHTFCGSSIFFPLELLNDVTTFMWKPLLLVVTICGRAAQACSASLTIDIAYRPPCSRGGADYPDVDVDAEMLGVVVDIDSTWCAKTIEQEVAWKVATNVSDDGSSCWQRAATHLLHQLEIPPR